MREGPIITFIGKPNNGKSSIISTLTMDDRIEIGREAGTTTQVNKYHYRFRNQIVATFYDTPGFEHPRFLYRSLQERGLKGTIQELGRRGYWLDREILVAAYRSDILSFVVDSSALPNLNTHGYELWILKYLNRDSIVILNPHREPDRRQEWEEFLGRLQIRNILQFNPTKSGFFEIQRFFSKVEKFFPEIKGLRKWHSLDFENRLNRSFRLIADKVAEIVQFRHQITIEKGERGRLLERFKFKKGHSLPSQGGYPKSYRKSYQIERGKEEFFELLNLKERELHRQLKELWGYYRTPVQELQFPIEDEVFNKKLGFSWSKMVLSGLAVGAAVGVVDGGITIGTTLGTTLLSFAAAGGVAGASIKPVVDQFSKEVTFQLDRRKGEWLMIAVILRSLEFLETLLKHGHANRAPLPVPADPAEWRYRKEIFSKQELKELRRIYRNFWDLERVREGKERLAHLLSTKFYF